MWARKKSNTKGTKEDHTQKRHVPSCLEHQGTPLDPTGQAALLCRVLLPRVPEVREICQVKLLQVANPVHKAQPSHAKKKGIVSATCFRKDIRNTKYQERLRILPVGSRSTTLARTSRQARETIMAVDTWCTIASHSAFRALTSILPICS